MKSSAPAEFVVVRHRVSHTDESGYRTAQHLQLDDWTVQQVLRRTELDQFVVEDQFVDLLRNAKRRPTWREFNFQIPNPENWYRSFDAAYLSSGEPVAAEIDGIPIVPARHLVYVNPEDASKATKAAFGALAEIAPKEQANLTIRLADPWLRPDEKYPTVVEKGQRLLDYAESKQIQLVRGLQRVR